MSPNPFSPITDVLGFGYGATRNEQGVLPAWSGYPYPGPPNATEADIDALRFEIALLREDLRRALTGEPIDHD